MTNHFRRWGELIPAPNRGIAGILFSLQAPVFNSGEKQRPSA